MPEKLTPSLAGINISVCLMVGFLFRHRLVFDCSPSTRHTERTSVMCCEIRDKERKGAEKEKCNISLRLCSLVFGSRSRLEVGQLWSHLREAFVSLSLVEVSFE